jgi:predicted ATP-grasp superfamily ATP-dependent carboligase
MNVLVTDGHERPALAITRSLGRRGVRVTVAAHGRPSLAGASRYCAQEIVCPSPESDPAAFEAFLLAVLERTRVDVLLPVTDVTTQIVAGRRDTFAKHAALALPPASAFEAATDKVRLLEHAAALGVPVPRTVVVRGMEQLADLMPRLDYPAVVKPFRSRIPVAGGWRGTSVHHAGDARQLRDLFRSVDYLRAHPSLVQQRIVGAGEGLFVLFDRGRLLAAFAHRRLREKPPSGGVSVLRESVRADDRLVDYANRLLAPIGWHGPAMVEFKRDAETRQPYLIEVNGRFWGSLQLAIDAGVDFPWMSCQLALGQSVQAPAGYRIGVRSRWLLGDLDHLFLRLFRANRALALPPGTPSRLRTLVDFLSCRPRDLNFEVLRPDDLRPFLREAADYVRALSRSVRRSAAASRSPRAEDQPAFSEHEEYRHAG